MFYFADCVKKLREIHTDVPNSTQADTILEALFCLGGRGKKERVWWGDTGGPVVCLAEVNQTQRWMAVGHNYFAPQSRDPEEVNWPSLHTRGLGSVSVDLGDDCKELILKQT